MQTDHTWPGDECGPERKSLRRYCVFLTIPYTPHSYFQGSDNMPHDHDSTPFSSGPGVYPTCRRCPRPPSPSFRFFGVSKLFSSFVNPPFVPSSSARMTCRVRRPSKVPFPRVPERGEGRIYCTIKGGIYSKQVKRQCSIFLLSLP